MFQTSVSQGCPTVLSCLPWHLLYLRYIRSWSHLLLSELNTEQEQKELTCNLGQRFNKKWFNPRELVIKGVLVLHPTLPEPLLILTLRATKRSTILINEREGNPCIARWRVRTTRITKAAILQLDIQSWFTVCIFDILQPCYRNIHLSNQGIH